MSTCGCFFVFLIFDVVCFTLDCSFSIHVGTVHSAYMWFPVICLLFQFSCNLQCCFMHRSGLTESRWLIWQLFILTIINRMMVIFVVRYLSAGDVHWHLMICGQFVMKTVVVKLCLHLSAAGAMRGLKCQWRKNLISMLIAARYLHIYYLMGSRMAVISIHAVCLSVHVSHATICRTNWDTAVVTIKVNKNVNWICYWGSAIRWIYD